MAADDPNSQRDRKEIEEKFTQLRPEVLETLRTLLYTILGRASLHGISYLGRTSHLQQALALATTYTDFPSLASLLLRPMPYPPTSNHQAPLIQDYLAKYGDAFGSEVVRWCIEQSEESVVFAEESVWGPIMDKLFARDPKGKRREGEERTVKSEYNSVAWINDMGRDRFGDASRRLLGEARGASDLGVKHVGVAYSFVIMHANGSVFG
jgi:nuclear pore complex protein Nup133